MKLKDFPKAPTPPLYHIYYNPGQVTFAGYYDRYDATIENLLLKICIYDGKFLINDMSIQKRICVQFIWRDVRAGSPGYVRNRKAGRKLKGYEYLYA